MDEEAPDLSISGERLFYIIMKAREFDEKVAPGEMDEGSNPSDDNSVSILEDYADDPTLQELQTALDDLNVDAQLDLLALMWFGRGDTDSFAEARVQAADTTDKHIPGYLIGTPQLSDYLEEALSQLGISVTEFGEGHL
ncbi:DUF3775 domain-containing protein [Futiania mangrovi]|uniref:DUF3775 domain-containing protein n=1 Tax=Futiania mangrovi TaxID=2959716 RepID=A0A9J6PGS5_9PROT|nr:DUF3775 domain-containing protein [Futiania mangrovii]MCP1337024.1 DUF3775 domain-containing protein [Futiania mangrovii]